MKINLECERILTPDLCFFLDVNPDTCKERIDQALERPELYEKSAPLMRQTRQNFLDIFDKLISTQNIAGLDANMGLDEVAKEILNYV